MSQEFDVTSASLVARVEDSTQSQGRAREITALTLERVATAIEQAQCPNREGPYGLYDYTSYGHPKPHHVRDFRDPRSATWGHAVLMTTDREEAEATYRKLTREHIARAAIDAVLAETPPSITAKRSEATDVTNPPSQV